MTENNTADMVNWLEDTQTVGEWDMAECFRGFIIKEAMAFKPDKIPNGWYLSSVNGSQLYIRKDD